MKLPYKESFAYYASCMMLFNLIYLMKNLMSNIFCPSCMNWDSWHYRFDVLSFGVASLFLIIGIASTFFICNSNDCVKGSNTEGTRVTIRKIYDDTSDTFFSKFSLLVLTGLSLPVCSGLFGFIIYLIVVISIGLVYTDKNLIYINPFLSLLHYSIYRCVCIIDGNNEEKQYYFFKRGNPPEKNHCFCFQKMSESRKIIRLKKLYEKGD